MSDTDLSLQLGELLEEFVRRHAEEIGGLPQRQHEPDWPSPCEMGEADAHGRVLWRPRPRDDGGNFAGVEAALDVELHADIKAYYTSFWSDSIDVASAEGDLMLIQVWNADDFERLCENILGHALAKRRAKAPLTIFFACTDEAELTLSVDNETGEVVLENPGEAPLRVIESSLPAFLRRVRPVVTRWRD